MVTVSTDEGPRMLTVLKVGLKAVDVDPTIHSPASPCASWWKSPISVMPPTTKKPTSMPTGLAGISTNQLKGES